MFRVSTLCYLQKGDEILFLHRTKKGKVNYGKYIGLGGKLEKNETPEECVVREVKEEAGVEICNPVLRGIITFPLKYDTSLDTKDYWITFLYTTKKWKGQMFDVSPEGKLVWINKNKINTLNLWEGDTIFLKEVLEGDSFFTLDLEYEEEKLINHILRKSE